MESNCDHMSHLLETALGIGVDAYGKEYYVEKETFSKLDGGMYVSRENLEKLIQTLTGNNCETQVTGIQEGFSEILPSIVTYDMMKENLVKDGFEWYQKHRRQLTTPPESIDYRPTMLEPRQQGGILSCVAFAFTAVFEWFQNQENDGEDQYFSPNFLYRHRCVNNDAYCYEAEGLSYNRAIDTMVNVGMIPEVDMPYDLATQYDSYEEIESRHLEQAKMTRVHQVMSIHPEDTYPDSYTDEEKTEHLKVMMLEFGPGIISVGGWNYAEDSSLSTGWRIFFDTAGECAGEYCRHLGGHSMAAVGYDEFGLIIRNSWGTRWGGDGHANFPWEEIWNGIGNIQFIADRNLADDDAYGSEYRCAHPTLNNIVRLQNHELSEQEICEKGFANFWNPSGDNQNYPGCGDCTCCHKRTVEEIQGTEKDNYKGCYMDDSLLTMGRAFHHTLGGSECVESCSDTDSKFLICRGDGCGSKGIDSRLDCQQKVDQLINEGTCHSQGVFYTNLCESDVIETPECGCLRPGMRRVFVKNLDYMAVFQIKERCPFTGQCPIWGEDYCPNSDWCGGWGKEIDCEGQWGCCSENGVQKYEVQVPASGHFSAPCEFRHGATQQCTHNPDDICHSQVNVYPTKAPTNTPDRFGEYCGGIYDMESDGSREHCVHKTDDGKACNWCGLHNGLTQRCCRIRDEGWRFVNNFHCADAIFHEDARSGQNRCAAIPDWPTYRVITSGACDDDVILDRRECQHAARYFDLGYEVISMDYTSSQASTRPIGCHEDLAEGKLVIRKHEEGIKCSDSMPCICRAKIPGTPTKSPNTSPPSLAKVEWELVKDGSCSENAIPTEAQCHMVAEELGYGEANTESESRWPPGCYQYKGRDFYYNRNMEGSRDCSRLHPCICLAGESAEDLGCGVGNPGPSGCDNQCGSTKVDLGCGCDQPGPSGCDNQCGSTKVDLGCGCGQPGPSGCDNQCGSTKVDLGCGCDQPGPSGCDNQCGSTKVDLGCGCDQPGPSGCDNQCGSTKVDLGCGCDQPGPSGCDNQCGSTKVDLGCGCDQPGPSGCDNQCGSTKVDLGCGCGQPGPSGCDNQCGSTKVDLGCGCDVPGPSGCDNQCGSTAVDEGCGCGIVCHVECADNDAGAVEVANQLGFQGLTGCGDLAAYCEEYPDQAKEFCPVTCDLCIDALPSLVCDQQIEGQMWEPVESLSESTVETWQECGVLCENAEGCAKATFDTQRGECSFSGPGASLVEGASGCRDEDEWDSEYCSDYWVKMYINYLGCAWFVDTGYGNTQCHHPYAKGCCKASCGICESGDIQPIAVECHFPQEVDVATSQETWSYSSQSHKIVSGFVMTGLLLVCFAIGRLSCGSVKGDYSITEQEEI